MATAVTVVASSAVAVFEIASIARVMKMLRGSLRSLKDEVEPMLGAVTAEWLEAADRIRGLRGR